MLPTDAPDEAAAGLSWIRWMKLAVASSWSERMKLAAGSSWIRWLKLVAALSWIERVKLTAAS